MFPPATPGSTLNEHPDAGIAYIRVSSCLYKQFIHLSLYLPEVFPRCYAHSRERQQNVPTDFPIAAWPLWRPCRLPSLQRRFHRNFEGSLLAKVPLWSFGKHIQDQLRISHIIPEVFFLKPLYALYSFVVLSDQVFVIISVKKANCTPSSIPQRFHSSVRFLRISMLFNR